jgi:hypothetical protein
MTLMAAQKASRACVCGRRGDAIDIEACDIDAKAKTFEATVVEAMHPKQASRPMSCGPVREANGHAV